MELFSPRLYLTFILLFNVTFGQFKFKDYWRYLPVEYREEDGVSVVVSKDEVIEKLIDQNLFNELFRCVLENDEKSTYCPYVDPNKSSGKIYLELARVQLECQTIFKNYCLIDIAYDKLSTPAKKSKFEANVLEIWVKNHKTNKTVTAEEKEKILKLYNVAKKHTLCLGDCETRCGGDIGCLDICSKKCANINSGLFHTPSLTLLITLLALIFYLNKII